MNFDSFIAKWLDKAADWDGAYGAQCVDLARYYWHEVCEIAQPRSVIGAKDFWVAFESDPNLNQNFTKIPNTPDGVPQKGDVMIWGPSYGPYGHIAVFISGDVNSFTAFSQNDPVGTLSIKKGYRNYYGVLGWFRPNKDVNEGVETPESDEMLLEYLGVSSTDEAKARLAEHLGGEDQCEWGNATDDMGGYLGSERRKNDELVRQNGELETEVESQKEQIRVLNDELENCSESEEIPIVDGFTANGLQIEKEKTDGKIIINYERT